MQDKTKKAQHELPEIAAARIQKSSRKRESTASDENVS